MTMCRIHDICRTAATAWRSQHGAHTGGVVLIHHGNAYGWKDSLRNPEHEAQGSFAVDACGSVYEAVGGDAYNGAQRWELVSEGTKS
jgi:hypothetical protein